MSKVQVRQISAKPLTNTQQIVGSWFPTGYYGHFRAKSRVDVCDYFRQLARPDPPKKFFDRQNSAASSHLFSRHDNRIKVECDPLVRGVQINFGKRKSQANTHGEFNPFFISWNQSNVDDKKYHDNIKITSNNNDYNQGSPSAQNVSNIQAIHSSVPSSRVSVYSTTFNHGQPDEEKSRQIRQETFQRYLDSQTRRLQIRLKEPSKNVASCLVWNNNIRDKTRTTKTDDTKIKNVMAESLESRINSLSASTIKRQKQLQGQSMQTFELMKQPQEHDNDQGIPPAIREVNPFDQIYSNSMNYLISKYM